MCKQQPWSLANSKAWLQWSNQIVCTESLQIKFWNLSCLINFITGFFLYGLILFSWLIMPTFVSYFATMPHPPLIWEFMDCCLGLGIKMSLNHSIRITPSSHNTSYNLFSCLSAMLSYFIFENDFMDCIHLFKQLALLNKFFLFPIGAGFKPYSLWMTKFWRFHKLIRQNTHSLIYGSLDIAINRPTLHCKKLKS